MPLIQTCLRRNEVPGLSYVMESTAHDVCGSPPLEYFCVRTCSCMCTCMYIQCRERSEGRAEVKARCLPQSLSTSSYATCSFTESDIANMAGRPASPKGLSPPSQCWDYKQALVSQFLQWILSVPTGVLMLALQACDRLKHLSRPTSLLQLSRTTKNRVLLPCFILFHRRVHGE